MLVPALLTRGRAAQVKVSEEAAQSVKTNFPLTHMANEVPTHAFSPSWQELSAVKVANWAFKAWASLPFWSWKFEEEEEEAEEAAPPAAEVAVAVVSVADADESPLQSSLPSSSPSSSPSSPDEPSSVLEADAEEATLVAVAVALAPEDSDPEAAAPLPPSDCTLLLGE